MTAATYRARRVAAFRALRDPVGAAFDAAVDAALSYVIDRAFEEYGDASDALIDRAMDHAFDSGAVASGADLALVRDPEWRAPVRRAVDLFFVGARA